LNAEDVEGGGFAFIERVLKDVVYTAAARATTKTDTQIIEILGVASGNNLDIAVFCITDPAAKVQFAGLSVNKPAKTDTLHAATDKKVKHHQASLAETEEGMQE
jgi:hypothetical protein